MGVVIDTGVFIRWERDYELLTTNVAEFRRIPNLRVLDYPNSS